MGKESEKTIAERCAERVLGKDRVMENLGIELQSVQDGAAVLSMTVGAEMLNSQGNCHGGMIFTLADAAFAFACISCNQAGIGAYAAMDFIRPAAEGDILTARSSVRHRGSTVSLVEVLVENQDGRPIAQLHGRSHNFGRPFLDESDGQAVTL